MDLITKLTVELETANKRIAELEPLAEIGRAIKAGDEEVQKFIDELKEKSKVDPKLLDEPADI